MLVKLKPVYFTQQEGTRSCTFPTPLLGAESGTGRGMTTSINSPEISEDGISTLSQVERQMKNEDHKGNITI